MTIHLRQATPRPSTVDAENRTVEAIVSTGADVLRPGLVERLDLLGADLSRLPGGPVLDGHRSGSTRDQLGVIEAAELRSEGLWVRIRFRSNEAARAVLADIGDGTLRGLSIGYTVAEWREEKDGKNRVRIATKWTPMEVSVVPVPADAGAHFRNGETTMETQEQTVETTTETQRETRASVNAQIRTIAQTAGLTRAWADAQIDAEATAETAREAAFTEMQRRSQETTTRNQRAVITLDNDAPEVFAQRAGEALFARSHPDHQLSAEARQYAGMRMADLAGEALRLRGISTTGMSDSTRITRALERSLGGLHTTSDFENIALNAGERELQRAYLAAASGIKKLARQTQHRDFREKSMVALGDAPELQKVSESGEYKYGTISEGAESFKLDTYGKIFGITRQVLINDDLGAFTRVPQMMGQSAARFEAKMLAGMIESNPQMSDGEDVFSEAHSNLADASAIITSGISGARRLLREQTGLDGALINVAPKYLLVNPARETEAELALAAITAAKTADANPFSNLELIVDPYLTDNSAWYMVADPALADGLVYAYLEGAPGPQIETKVGFDVDGILFKVRLDFGAGWIDYRSMVKNPGSSPA